MPEYTLGAVLLRLWSMALKLKTDLSVCCPSLSLNQQFEAVRLLACPEENRLTLLDTTLGGDYVTSSQSRVPTPPNPGTSEALTILFSGDPHI